MSRVDILPFPQPLRGDFAHPSPDVVNAYKMCNLAQDAVNPQAILDRLPFYAQDESVRMKLIHIRILGRLLSQSPFLSDAAISQIARGTISCQKDTRGTDETNVKALDKLGEIYRDFFLRPCGFRASRTQVDSSDAAVVTQVHRHKDESPDVFDDGVSSPSSTESYPPDWASFPLAEEEVGRLLSEILNSYSTARKLVCYGNVLHLPFDILTFLAGGSP